MQFTFDKTETGGPGQLIVRNLKCSLDDGTKLTEDFYVHDAKHEDNADPDMWSIASEKYVMGQIAARARVIADAHLGINVTKPPFSDGGTVHVDPTE